MVHAEASKYSQPLASKLPIQQWVNLLPITSLCAKISINNGIEDSFYFVMSVDKEYAELFELDINEPIKFVECERVLVYKNKITVNSEDVQENNSLILKEPLEFIKKHNFEIIGDIYTETLYIANYEKERSVFMIVYIPIK